MPYPQYIHEKFSQKFLCLFSDNDLIGYQLHSECKNKLNIQKPKDNTTKFT